MNMEKKSQNSMEKTDAVNIMMKIQKNTGLIVQTPALITP